MESRRDFVGSDSVGITCAKSGMGVQTSVVSLGKRTARSGGGLGTRCREGSDSDGRHGGNRRRGAERYWWGGSGGSVVRRAEREPREGGLADCGSAGWFAWEGMRVATSHACGLAGELPLQGTCDFVK